MRIAVMGAGGVGGYFGARLAQAGHGVAFIARGKHLQAIRAKGLAIKSPLGDAMVKAAVAEDPEDLGAADVVLFAVKLWDTESAAERIRPLVEMGGVVIPFQNGVESIARIGEPGVIVHTGPIARLRFGTTQPTQRKTAEAFLGACKDAKIDAELADDIERVLWEKFVLLVAISATTAVTRKTIGTVRTDPDLRWLLETVMRETWTVGRKRGVALGDDLVAKTLAQADSFTPDMRASMAADLEAGGKLEARWLSGAVARMAREDGIEAIANRTIYAALKPYENGR